MNGEISVPLPPKIRYAMRENMHTMVKEHPAACDYRRVAVKEYPAACDYRQVGVTVEYSYRGECRR